MTDSNSKATPNVTPQLNGRREIRSKVREITSDNVLSVVNEVMTDYMSYKTEVLYLWNYYRGVQPILRRTTEIRPELIFNMVENRANEIVSFKVGYQFGEPVKYVGREATEDVTDGIKRLNDMMFFENKHSHDRDLCEWWEICGTSYRMVLPDPRDENDGVPFEIYTLDPSCTFVIYSTDFTHRPLAGVIVTSDDFGEDIWSIYTDKMLYTVKGGLFAEAPHAIGYMPIIEYKANNARLGSFEVVIPILDAINQVESNRVEAVDHFVQALTVMYNVDLDVDGWEELRKQGLIKLKSVDGVLKPDVEMLTSELNQTQTQTLIDYMYQTVLTICGMPNRNTGSQTGDTGAAVMLRDGWSLAEARAKDVEWSFKRSEAEFIRIVLRICEDMLEDKLGLTVADIDMSFTRRNYEAALAKSEVLTMLISSGWVSPLDAYKVCGLFSDPEGAYLNGREFHESQPTQVVANNVAERNSEDI